jgi:glycosyltransferase involved in cell wall biosynthesis
MNDPITVSVVLGSYNRLAFLKTTLESVRANGMDFPHEIIVVDGGSTDGSLKYLTKQKDVITIIQHNRGEFRGRKIARRSWGYFMNLGFKAAQGKYILMISDDSLIIPGAILNGVEEFEKRLAKDEKIGALAFYWRNWPEQKEYMVGLTLGDKIFVNHGLFLRTALEEVGWIDEDHYQFYHADGDLCLKLWQSGYKIADCPNSFIEHFTHSNQKVRKENMVSQQKDWQTYLERWTNIYYDPVRNNSGGCLCMDYLDKSFIVASFPLLNRFTVLVNLKLKHIWVNQIKTIIKSLVVGKIR